MPGGLATVKGFVNDNYAKPGGAVQDPAVAQSGLTIFVIDIFCCNFKQMVA